MEEASRCPMRGGQGDSFKPAPVVTSANRIVKDKPALTERLGRYFWIVGIGALAAWFALLWFMFGDVL